MPTKIMANNCQFINSKRSKPRPFRASVWHNYRDVEQVCRNSSPTVCTIAGLLVSRSIITGLANADMDDASLKRGKFMAKKLLVNNDGMISLEELTSRQNKRFQILNLNGDGMID